MSCNGYDNGLAIKVSTKSPNVPFLIAVVGTGTTRTVTISVDYAGNFLIRAWLCNSADPQDVTVAPPSGDATTQWLESTNASGVWTKQITHDASGTWYMAAVIVGPVAMSAAIAF